MLDSSYNGHRVYLVENVQDLQKMYQFCKANANNYVGVDTETSGLNTDARVVGVCISAGPTYSPNDYRGFYVPIRHTNYDNNLPIDLVIRVVQSIVDNCKSFWWNRNFDFNMLSRDGFLPPCPGKTEDGQLFAFLASGEPFPALKDWTEKLLHFEVIHFSDNNADKGNFGSTDPRVTFVYAAADPIITVRVSMRLWRDNPFIHKIFPLDNTFAECMRRIMETTNLYLDVPLLQKQLDENIMRQSDIKRKIFALTGYEFKLNSNIDKADALSRFVTLSAKTASGKYDVSKHVLSEIDHPLAKLLIEYSNLEKFRGTYLEKMIKFPQPFHINYQHCNAATGRMSSGASKGNDYYAPFNIQNVPKVEVLRYLHRAPSLTLHWELDDYPYEPLAADLSLSTPQGFRVVNALKEGDQVITNHGTATVTAIGLYEGNLSLHALGCSEGAYINKEVPSYAPYSKEYKPYYIDLALEDGTPAYSVTTSIGDVQVRCLTKLKCKGGMRDAFICPEGYLWLSADYSSEEMVLSANFSKEPNLIQPLLDGADIHKYVALKMFGTYDKTKRTAAKGLNFACAYGAGPASIAENLGVSLQEGKSLLERYNNTLAKLTAWKKAQIANARRKGIVFSYFGRPRTLYKYYQASDTGLHAFADRCSLNTPIQGSGADIIRMDHVKYYKMHDDPTSPLYDKEFAENTLYAVTVHDEINLFVKPEYMAKGFTKLKEIMEMTQPNWAVPLKVSPSIGVSWGKQIELLGFDDNGVPIPDIDPEDMSLL